MKVQGGPEASVHECLTFALRGLRRYVVAQLVEELRYKAEGRGFDSRWSGPQGL
jgi:hypothetical protein